MTHSHDAGGVSGQKMNIVQYDMGTCGKAAHIAERNEYGKGCVALAQVIENTQEGWNT